MKLTKEQASEKYPGVGFVGNGEYVIDHYTNIGTGASIDSGAVIESGVFIGSGAFIGPNVIINSGAGINSGARIYRGGSIGSDANIEHGATIKAGAVVGYGATIGSGAIIEPRATIDPNSNICSGAIIGSGRKGVKNTLVLNGLGETRQMTAHDSDDGLVIVIGCLNGYKGVSLEEAKIAISKKYPDAHPYFAALRLAQTWYESL